MSYLRSALSRAQREAFMDTVYRVETVTNRKTGLLIGICAELPGLYVHGRTQDEIDARAPIAIKAMLEAQGHEVKEVVRCDDELPDAFEATVARYALDDCVPA